MPLERIGVEFAPSTHGFGAQGWPEALDRTKQFRFGFSTQGHIYEIEEFFVNILRNPGGPRQMLLSVSIDNGPFVDLDTYPLSGELDYYFGTAIPGVDPLVVTEQIIISLIPFDAPSSSGTLEIRNINGIANPTQDERAIVLYANTTPAPPPPVIADAGPDQSVSAFDSVQLDGTNSTPEADITSYLWQQIAGPSVTLSDDSSPTPSFTAPQPAEANETLIFQLTVTDAAENSATDTVAITVQGVPVVTASKTVSVWSETGSNCANPAASPPATPALPAAIPGACVEYVITLTNSGPVPATDVALADALPSQLTLRTAMLGGDWGAGATLVFTPGCTGSGCVVEVSNGTVPAQASRQLTLRASIN